MPVRPFGSGYDPNSGWPPDDSTGIPWDNNVDLSGQFGPGGFAPNPKLTGPATGPPPGVSLSGPGGNGSAINPDQVIPPDNSTIPNMKSVGPFTGGSATDAIISGAQKFLPKIIGRRLPLADLVTPTDEIAGPTGVELPRTLGRSPTGPAGPGITRGPVPVNPPIPTPFTQPQHPSTMRYPGWPTPPAPGPAAAPMPMPARPVTPTPATAYGYPMPPPRPRAASAGPAATTQQPNLGAYDGTITRPNMDVVQGGRNNPGQQTQMGVADWSKLFQRPQQ